MNKDEKGVYQLLDTLKTVPKFKSYYNLISILGSGYVEVDKWDLDIGDVYSVLAIMMPREFDYVGVHVPILAKTTLGDWRAIWPMVLKIKE